MTTPPELPSISGAIEGAEVGGALGANPNGPAPDSGGSGFQVQAEGLLNAANKLQDKIQVLNKALHHEGLKNVGKCGPDLVSSLASAAFQAQINPLVQHCTTYVGNMTTAVNTLRDQAKKYGATDEQIAQSWTSFIQQQHPTGQAPK